MGNPFGFFVALVLAWFGVGAYGFVRGALPGVRRAVAAADSRRNLNRTLARHNRAIKRGYRVGSDDYQRAITYTQSLGKYGSKLNRNHDDDDNGTSAGNPRRRTVREPHFGDRPDSVLLGGKFRRVDAPPVVGAP